MHTSRSYKEKRKFLRKFLLEDDAEQLIQGLNGMNVFMGTGEDKRRFLDKRPLIIFVKRLQTLDDLIAQKKNTKAWRRLVASDGRLFGPKATRTSYERLMSALMEIYGSPGIKKQFFAINRFLNRYIAIPQIDVPTFSLDPEMKQRGWQLAWRTRRASQSLSESNHEMEYALKAIKLAEMGKISSLNQCATCRRWFFRRFAHQKFCKAGCKEQFHRSDPADKERRREYARKLYRLHKELDSGKTK